MDTPDSSMTHRMVEDLKDLMVDTEMYGWEKTCAFDGVWMNQMEPGCCFWLDDDEKLKFR